MSRSAPLLAALCALLASAGVQAHAHLEQADPADGSRLSSAPRQLTLRFSEATRITRLWITPRGAAALSPPRLPAESARELTIPLPTLGPGEYVVRWRMLSADGHVLEKALRFSIVPPH